MYRLSADTLDFANSFPAVIPDFDSRHSKKLIIKDPSEDFPLTGLGKDACSTIVLIHCHYPDLLAYFIPYLSRISDYDLLVTITSPEFESLVSEWACMLKPNLKKPRDLLIRCLPNSGRDVGPFWETGIEIFSKYSVFLKIHTKTSPQYKDHIGLIWLKDILENLLIDASTIQQITDIIGCGEYGAVFPVPWKPFRYWGWTNRTNFYHAQEVCKALSIDSAILLNPLQYPVGNMYWGSTSILRSYGEKILSSLSWPQEPLPTDGTLLHSLERLTGYLYIAEGKKIAYSACPKTTTRGLGLFSWHVEDTENRPCELFYPISNDKSFSSLTGRFSPAYSLAFFSCAINTSMFPKKTMLPRTKLDIFINNVLSYPAFVKRILIDDFLYLSAVHLRRDTLTNRFRSDTNPFLDYSSTPGIRLQIRMPTRVFQRLICSFNKVVSGVHSLLSR